MSFSRYIALVFFLVPLFILGVNAQASTPNELIGIIANNNLEHHERKDAADRLAFLKDKNTLSPLIDLLSRDNYYAFVTLREMKHEDSLLPLIALLQQGNAYAAQILGKFKNEAAQAALLEAVKNNRNWDARRQSIKALQTVGAPEVKEAIASSLLNDKSHWVRRVAAETLALEKDRFVVDAYIRALKDSDVEVRRLARLALKYSDDPRAKRAMLSF